MPSYVTPVKNTAFVLQGVTLTSQANTKIAQVNPTLATGDVTVSIDGGTAATITTLPTVTPSGGKRITLSLSAAEMNGDNTSVVFSDAAGSEWCDLTITLQTTPRGIGDLAYPATSGRSLAVDASGQVTIGAIASGIIAAASFASGALNAAWDRATSGITANDGTIGGWIKYYLDALVSGTLKPTVPGRNLDVTATGAAGIDLANVENQSTTLALSGTTIKAVTDPVSATVSDKTGFSLSPAGILAIFAQLMSAITANDGTFGGWIKYYLDALVSGALKPSVAGRNLDVSATGEAGIDWNNIGTPGATQNLAATTIKAQNDPISTSISPADIAAIIDGLIPEVDRILNAVSSSFTRLNGDTRASVINVVQGDTWAERLTLAAFAWATGGKLKLSIKDAQTYRTSTSDADSILQWFLTFGGSVSDGLTYINQAAAGANRTKGSLAVTDDDNGQVTLNLDEVISLLLQGTYVWDIKHYSVAGDVTTLGGGTIVIEPTITYSIT